MDAASFVSNNQRPFELPHILRVDSKVCLYRQLNLNSLWDIDGIRTVSEGINAAIRGTDSGALIITHYSRILEHVQPDMVHVLMDGKIVSSGGPELATKLEERGYEWLK